MKGYDDIGSYGRKVFDMTHTKHLKAMGTEKRKQYERDKVKSIKTNNEEQCLEVSFKNGEFFKYTPALTWH